LIDPAVTSAAQTLLLSSAWAPPSELHEENVTSAALAFEAAVGMEGAVGSTEVAAAAASQAVKQERLEPAGGSAPHVGLRMKALRAPVRKRSRSSTVSEEL
jgi:hypothetical protein